MATRQIIGWLSEEDREHAATLYLRAMVAQSGNPNMSVDECVEAMRADLDNMRRLREKYDIADDEAIEFSMYDGAITESEE